MNFNNIDIIKNDILNKININLSKSLNDAFNNEILFFLKEDKSKNIQIGGNIDKFKYNNKELEFYDKKKK